MGDWNRCGCELAMAKDEDCSERRKFGGEMAVKEGVIGFSIRSPFNGGFSEEHVMAKGVTPRFTGPQTVFP
jgi:hypothetical protein